VLLRIEGIACSRENLQKEVPITGEGASLLDLKRVAERFGMDTEVVKLAPVRLIERTPAIARLAVDEVGTDAHFVVVVKGNADELDIVDGTTGAYRTMPVGAFERCYSGFALIRGSYASNNLMFALLGILVAESLAVVLVVLWR